MEIKAPIIIGMDEAGRGSWAGPVVAAAVYLSKGARLPGLNDSKKLTAKKQEELFEKITARYPYGVGSAKAAEVDELGLTQATFLAFSRALEALPLKPDHLLIDGRDPFQFEIPHTSVIKGDQIHRCISAASIVAKVTRDRLMCDLAKKHPAYAFESHKGYGTARHQKALKENGILNFHRKSYEPVKLYI